MMFVGKEKVVLYFKIAVFCLMTIMLICFVTTVFNERKGVVTLNSVIEKPSRKMETCMSEYITYCGLALFLGAFVNVKRLIKLGIV